MYYDTERAATPQGRTVTSMRRPMRLTVLARCSAAGVLLACAEPAAPRTEPDPPDNSIPPGPYVAGQSYFGRNSYIEYLAGNAPVILTAPHGGAVTPGEIPDRTAASCGGEATTVTDLNTRELTLAVRQAFFARFGKYPHVVINHLHRRKLDANRAILEAACNDAEAQIAFNQFHDFLAVARNAVLAANGRGWYMDLHGHGHSIQRLELGYLLTSAQLRLADGTLDASTVWQDSSSINTLSVRDTERPFSTVLRGATSLGSLYAAHSFAAVPSASDPAPQASDAYFTGGYNTERYGCSITAGRVGGVSSGNLCGVQIEANFTGVRDTEANRARFAEATANVLEVYLRTHWDIVLQAPAPGAHDARRAGPEPNGATDRDLRRDGTR
jgi:hypothetical protein